MMKNKHQKSPHQILCNSPKIQMFFFVFLIEIFFPLLKKYMFCVFFQKWTEKIWQLKNWNYHPNPWTILLLVIRRFSNYAQFYCSFIDRKCRKLWQPAPSLCPPPLPYPMGSSRIFVKRTKWLYFLRKNI